MGVTLVWCELKSHQKLSPQTLYKESGEKRINDNALTALALFIAESDPNEKEIMINIIKNLIAN